MLQRGRGQGALAARTRSDAADLVLGCVLDDSRWDSQTEERDLYLARLVLALPAPLDAIRARVLDPVTWPAGSEQESGLACEVLLTLCRAGYRDADSIVREYLATATGPQWEAMIDQVWEYGEDMLRGDLHALVLPRLTDPDLDSLVDPGYGPWQTWAGDHPRGAAAFERRRQHRLATATPRRPGPPRRGDLQRLTSAQVADLTSDENPQTRRMAWVELGRRQDLSLLDLAETTTARTSFGTIPGLARAIDQLGSLAVDRARAWVGGPDGFLADTAMGVLAQYGTELDAPTLLDSEERACEQGWWYHVETCARGLGRLKWSPAVPHLVHAWEVTAHSHARHDLLTALQTINPQTAEEFAAEGLHDCESSVRTSSATVSKLSSETCSRLQRLRDDPLEDRDVRTAVARRLESSDG